jgi:hypothetical protein
LQLGGPLQRRTPALHAIEDALRSALAPGGPLRLLVGLPGARLLLRRGDGLVAEHVGVTPLELVGDRGGDPIEVECAPLLSHAGVEHHLEEQIAELVAQIIHVIPGDGVGHLVGLLDGIGGDGLEVLLAIPRATPLRVPECVHDGDESVDRCHRMGPPEVMAPAAPLGRILTIAGSRDAIVKQPTH